MNLTIIDSYGCNDSFIDFHWVQGSLRLEVLNSIINHMRFPEHSSRKIFSHFIIYSSFFLWAQRQPEQVEMKEIC